MQFIIFSFFCFITFFTFSELSLCSIHVRLCILYRNDVPSSNKSVQCSPFFSLFIFFHSFILTPSPKLVRKENSRKILMRKNNHFHVCFYFCYDSFSYSIPFHFTFFFPFFEFFFSFLFFFLQFFVFCYSCCCCYCWLFILLFFSLLFLFLRAIINNKLMEMRTFHLFLLMKNFCRMSY